MSTKNVNFYIVNNFGRKIVNLWASHRTSDTGFKYWEVQNIDSGSTRQLGPMQIVSNTSDYFTICWTDESNNLYGTPYEYKTETDMSDGDVQAQLESITSTVEFFQTGESDPLGTTPVLKYGAA